MILYHFPTSPFSRRVRLTLALKGLSAELRDARGNPAHREEVRRLNPMHTVPVLVDGDRVVLESMAIGHYLDCKVPDPPLWPGGTDGAEAFEVAALADAAMTLLVDLGLRYQPLHADASYPAVRAEMVGRVQGTLNLLGERVGARDRDGAPLIGQAWSAVDMTVYCMVSWLEGLPERAATFPLAKQIVDLGWKMPDSLPRWAHHHRQRADVVALAD